MYLLKKDLGLTFVEIGNLLGGRDHTTIMYGVTKVENLVEKSILSEDIMRISKLSLGRNAE
jgi:chromosomal replication initiator protein